MPLSNSKSTGNGERMREILKRVRQIEIHAGRFSVRTKGSTSDYLDRRRKLQ